MSEMTNKTGNKQLKINNYENYRTLHRRKTKSNMILEVDNSLQLQIIGSEDYEVGVAIKAALLHASNMESEAKEYLCENCEREKLLYDKLKTAIDARKTHAQKVSEARRKAIACRWNKRNTNQ